MDPTEEIMIGWNRPIKDHIQVRLTPEQYVMMCRSARGLGLKATDMIRSWITQHYQGIEIKGRVQ